MDRRFLMELSPHRTHLEYHHRIGLGDIMTMDATESEDEDIIWTLRRDSTDWWSTVREPICRDDSQAPPVPLRPSFESGSYGSGTHEVYRRSSAYWCPHSTRRGRVSGEKTLRRWTRRSTHNHKVTQRSSDPVRKRERNKEINSECRWKILHFCHSVLVTESSSIKSGFWHTPEWRIESSLESHHLNRSDSILKYVQKNFYLSR